MARPLLDKSVPEFKRPFSFRTIVFGRIYLDIEEVSAAVRGYFERYNHHWLLEKNGYRSPTETRRHWMAATITAQEAA